MTSRPPRPQSPQMRREVLVNWLALLALVALGVVWPGEEAPGVAPERARSAVQSARSGAQGTPSRQAQAPAGYALP
jgi:hypothetical protein